MGSMSIWHWLVVAVIVLLLFGRGKISELMGDMAKGIKAFKKGMAEEETAEKKSDEQAKALEQPTVQTASTQAQPAGQPKTN